MGVMRIMTVELGVELREELFEGRPHLVAPVIALVEGVHNDLFYPSEAIEDSIILWNGVPLPVQHPQIGGQFVSANTPEMIEEMSVGRLFNCTFDPDGSKLRGEIWVDIAKAQDIAPAILTYLEEGGRLEVSTGVYTDDDNLPGEWNGEHYYSSVTNFRPDHLALLPGGIGACSWTDGCGVRANEKEEEGGTPMSFDIRSQARRPNFEGTESVPWTDVTTTFAAYRDAYYQAHEGSRPDEIPARVRDAPTAMRSWIASKTLLGADDATDERNLIFFPVVNPRTGKLNEGALRAVISGSGRGSQAEIPAEVKTSAQSIASGLLNREFGAELEVGQSLKDKFVGMFKSLAETLGLTLLEMSHDDLRHQLQHLLDGMDVPGWLHYVKAVFDDHLIYEARGSNPSETGLGTTVSKLYTINFRASENGQVELQGDPQEVREERRFIPLEQTDGDKPVTPKPTAEQNTGVDQMDTKTLVDGLISNKQTAYEESDREWLTTLSECQLGKMAPVAAKAEEKPPAAAPAPEPTNPRPQPAAANDKAPADKPVTLAEYVAAAPEDLRGTLKAAVEVHEQVVAEVIDGLLKNPNNKFSKEELEAKSAGELEQLAALAQIEVDFRGQAGGPATSKNCPPEPLKVFENV